MSLNVFTVWFLVTVLAGATLVDVWLSLHGGQEATISATIWMLSQQYPVLPFILGLLAGHLLWPQGRR